jgi:uncharacterized protein (TIGR02145 family)
MPFFCEGCAAAGSDALFAKEQDVDPLCPYPGLNLTPGSENYQDLIACHQRPSKAANWEAWMIDERDCQPYRIVQMPDTLWWLARNLNYTKGLTDAVSSAADPASDGYWCPGAASFDSIAQGKPYTNPATNNSSAISGGDTACRTYGALYPWFSTIREDGIFDSAKVARAPNVHSTVRGICPKNWLLPSNRDWMVMFNAIEGCPDYGTETTGRYCLSAPYDGAPIHPGATIFAKTSTTISGHKDRFNLYPLIGDTGAGSDSVFATKTYPAWAWRSKYSNNPEYKKNIQNIPPNDYYGFSVLPAGFRYVNFFYDVAFASFFWTTSYATVFYRHNHNVSKKVFISGATTEQGSSVRCLRDVTKL